MNNWKKCKLGDIAEITMGQSPKSEFYNFDNIGMPFLQGNRTFGRKYPYFDTYCTEYKKIAKKGEILFSVRAPVGDINFANNDICIGRGLCSMNAKNGENEFLYYLLHSLRSVIINNESGSVFGSVNKNDLQTIEILLPPLEEQRQIAAILSSIDDKIELLHEQNKTLEELAQTLFRHYFIENPNPSWQNVKIKELASITSGKSLKRLDMQDDGENPILGANGIIGFTNKYLYNEPLLYTGRVGTLGKVFMINSAKKVWLSDNTLIIKPSSIFYFMYFVLKTSSLENLDVGSTQPLIRQSDLGEIEILLADDLLLEKFDITAKKIFDKIDKNLEQIQTLENMRDILIPKLLNGEIKINNKRRRNGKKQ